MGGEVAIVNIIFFIGYGIFVTPAPVYSQFFLIVLQQALSFQGIDTILLWLMEKLLLLWIQTGIQEVYFNHRNNYLCVFNCT